MSMASLGPRLARSLGIATVVVAVAVGFGPSALANRAPRSDAASRGRPTSAIGDATLRNAMRFVNPRGPVQTGALHAQLGFPKAWGEEHLNGLCAAFASTAIASTGRVPMTPMLYTDHLVRSLAMNGYRRTRLDRAPAGSIVALVTPERPITSPLHFSILADVGRNGMRVVESGYPAQARGGAHVVQLTIFDGKRWAGNDVRAVILAPPDTR